MTGEEGVIQFTAGISATQLGSKGIIGQKTGDHVDVTIMAIIQLLGQDEPENQFDRHAVRRVEIYGLGKHHQRAATVLHARYAAMGKCDSLVKTGAAEPLSFYQLCKDLLVGNIGIRVRQQFAQYFDTVLFAARVHIAKDAAGADKLFQYHER